MVWTMSVISCFKGAVIVYWVEGVEKMTVQVWMEASCVSYPVSPGHRLRGGVGSGEGGEVGGGEVEEWEGCDEGRW